MKSEGRVTVLQLEAFLEIALFWENRPCLWSGREVEAAPFREGVGLTRLRNLPSRCFPVRALPRWGGPCAAGLSGEDELALQVTGPKSSC